MGRDNGEKEKPKVSFPSSDNIKVVDLIAFTKNGRFYVQTEEKEWAEVTGVWRERRTSHDRR